MSKRRDIARCGWEMEPKSGGITGFPAQVRFCRRRRAAKAALLKRRRLVAARPPVYSGWNEVVAGTSEARSSASIGIMPFSVR